MAQILDEDRPLPPAWDSRMGDGLGVYRNAYRARLIAALAETFPRTGQWLGAELFETAAAHHLIVHPPTSWTLDLAGEGFVGTLAELFAGDPEVPDLAWLEWAMHRAFVVADCAPLNAAEFAAATDAYGDADWTNMRLVFGPSLAMREVGSDCGALWQALGRDEVLSAAPTLEARMHCLVWREGLDPVFALVSEAEATGLAAMRRGATFGDLCAALAQSLSPNGAAAAAGAMLGQWLQRGLVTQAAQGKAC